MINYTNPMDMLRHALDQQDQIHAVLLEILKIVRDMQTKEDNDDG